MLPVSISGLTAAARATLPPSGLTGRRPGISRAGHLDFPVQPARYDCRSIPLTKGESRNGRRIDRHHRSTGTSEDGHRTSARGAAQGRGNRGSRHCDARFGWPTNTQGRNDPGWSSTPIGVAEKAMGCEESGSRRARRNSAEGCTSKGPYYTGGAQTAC